jgi:hypothetical protein
VACLEGHRLERATVVRLVRDGKDFAFCSECGGRVDLPDLEDSGIGTGVSAWLRREEATARLRSTYEQHLSKVKGYRRGWATPRCYLSRTPGQESTAERLINDLQDAGVYIVGEAAQVGPDDYVVVLDTPAYQRVYHHPTPAFEIDVDLVKARLGDDKLVSIKLGGESSSAVPHDLDRCTPGDFSDATHYPVSLFNLVLNLYAIPFDHIGFAPLRASLHWQWTRAFGRKEKDDSKDIDEQVTQETVSLSDGAEKVIHVHGNYIEQRREDSMTKKKKARNNAWINGSFYLVLFIVVMTAFAVIGKTIPAVLLPVVIIGGLLTIGIIGAFQLRNDDSLSEKNFLTLILETYKRLPLLRGSKQRNRR